MKKNVNVGRTVKPIQRWTARELQARLLPVVRQAASESLRKLVPLLEKFAQDLETEKAAREKDLENFCVTGDADSQVLGVLAELWSRPMRAALLALNDRTFVVAQAKKIIEKRLARL